MMFPCNIGDGTVFGLYTLNMGSWVRGSDANDAEAMLADYGGNRKANECGTKTTLLHE